MPENILMRLVDRLGEKTINEAERAYKRATELSLVFKEQDEAARALLDKKKKEEEDKKKALEDRLSKIKEAVSLDVGAGKEESEFKFEREELKVPFSTRLINIVSDMFSGFSKNPTSFFKNIQEDLYKANIIMPASKYIAFAFGISVISGIGTGILAAILLGSIMQNVAGGLVGLVLGFPVFLFILMFSKMYPKSKVKSRSDAFSRDLPFALRHMATQLTSGAGLLETMRSVSTSDYGVLSEEFKRAIMEIERGATVEEAYERMNLRVDSAGLKKASRQIISTLRTGGNLANTLKIIAEEVATEMRMKLKDFIQVLNTFSMMFMFVVVVAPVLITTLVIAMGIAMKGLPMPPETMWILYFAFFGISIYLSVMVKRFEPKV